MRQVRVMVSCLQSEVGESSFDVVPYAKRAALDIICGNFYMLPKKFMKFIIQIDRTSYRFPFQWFPIFVGACLSGCATLEALLLV